MRCTHTSVQKNYYWVWITVDRLGNLYPSFVCGDRSTRTGLKFWAQIQEEDIGYYCTDYWKSYADYL
jgi:insertion element IS1 protein InsB